MKTNYGKPKEFTLRCILSGTAIGYAISSPFILIIAGGLLFIFGLKPALTLIAYFILSYPPMLLLLTALVWVVSLEPRTLCRYIAILLNSLLLLTLICLAFPILCHLLCPPHSISEQIIPLGVGLSPFPLLITLSIITADCVLFHGHATTHLLLGWKHALLHISRILLYPFRSLIRRILSLSKSVLHLFLQNIQTKASAMPTSNVPRSILIIVILTLLALAWFFRWETINGNGSYCSATRQNRWTGTIQVVSPQGVVTLK